MGVNTAFESGTPAAGIYTIQSKMNQDDDDSFDLRSDSGEVPF